MNIYSRRQPEGNVVLLDLFGCCRSHLFHKAAVPGAGQHRGTGPCGRADAALRSDTKAGRAVGCHEVRHAVLRQISEAEGVCHAGVRLAAQKFCKLQICKLRHKFIQGSSAFCHIDEHDLFLWCFAPELIAGSCPYCRCIALWIVIGPAKAVLHEIVGCSLGQFLEASVSQQSLRQLRRSHFLHELERHLILVKSPDETQQTCVADRISEIEMVISFFQDVGRFLHLTQIVVGSHGRRRNRENEGLSLAGFQLLRFFKGSQHTGRFA